MKEEFSKTQVLVDKTVSVIFCRKKSDKMLVEGKSFWRRLREWQ
jgi:hypothetical protein